MPHICIKHFPVPVDDQTRQSLSDDITNVICRHLGANADSVSIALQSVPAASWADQVFTPEILGLHSPFLIKHPGY